MAIDIITETFEDSQEAIAARVDDIFAAAAAKDFDRLASLHLQGPKFSKFDDEAPLDRQDATTAMRREAEQFAAVDDFQVDVDGLKVDVFGEVAVATALLTGKWEAEDYKVRMTLVLVHADDDWLIAHEHLSDIDPST